MLPTPCTDVLIQPQFGDVYPPSQDSFLFLDALEKDSQFLTEYLKPAIAIEIGDRTPGVADIILFNPPYVPTSVSEVRNAGCSVTAAWAGGIKGRQVIDEFIPQVSSRLSSRGVLYLLLLRENCPPEVHELVRKTSNGRLSEAVCLVERTCCNESLAVYRYYDPTVLSGGRPGTVRFGACVQYSDRAYLSNLFKTEFRKHAKETDSVFAEFLYKKGQSVLRNRRFI
ncbi:HemK methyltransferase member 2 [Sparganum proliferum]